MEILINLLIQIAGIVIVIFGFTFILYIISRAYINNTGRLGYTLNKITGLIGTPVHELSHAVFCIIFGHKINEMKLYTFQDGVLGYVNHSYNKKNIYQVFGNFFIGIAPVFGGTAIMILVIRLLTPGVFNDIFASMNNLTFNITSNDFLPNLYTTIKGVLLSFTNFSGEVTWKYIVMCIITICVSSHMLLSGADIKGAMGGFFVLILLLVIADTIMYFFSLGSVITLILLSGLIILIPFLCLALFVDLIRIVIMIVYKLFVR